MENPLYHISFPIEITQEPSIFFFTIFIEIVSTYMFDRYYLIFFIRCRISTYILQYYLVQVELSQLTIGNTSSNTSIFIFEKKC